VHGRRRSGSRPPSSGSRRRRAAGADAARQELKPFRLTCASLHSGLAETRMGSGTRAARLYPVVDLAPAPKGVPALRSPATGDHVGGSASAKNPEIAPMAAGGSTTTAADDPPPTSARSGSTPRCAPRTEDGTSTVLRQEPQTSSSYHGKQLKESLRSPSTAVTRKGKGRCRRTAARPHGDGSAPPAALIKDPGLIRYVGGPAAVTGARSRYEQGRPGLRAGTSRSGCR